MRWLHLLKIYTVYFMLDNFNNILINMLIANIAEEKSTSLNKATNMSKFYDQNYTLVTYLYLLIFKQWFKQYHY